MYCRNYSGTSSRVLCREVYYPMSLFGRAIGGFTVQSFCTFCFLSKESLHPTLKKIHSMLMKCLHI